MNLVQMLKYGPKLAAPPKRAIPANNQHIEGRDTNWLKVCESLPPEFTPRELADALGATGRIEKQYYEFLRRQQGQGNIEFFGYTKPGHRLIAKQLWRLTKKYRYEVLA